MGRHVIGTRHHDTGVSAHFLTFTHDPILETQVSLTKDNSTPGAEVARQSKRFVPQF